MNREERRRSRREALGAEDPGRREARLRRRRRLLAWSALPVILALVAGGWFAAVWGMTLAANHAVTDEHYDTAVRRYESVARLNPWLEQWRVSFNLGTARMLADDLDGAVTDLDRALELAPAAGTVEAQDSQGNTVSILDPSAPECLVRVNLYAVHTVLAQVATAVGDDATAAAEQAAATQAAGQCEMPPTPDPSPTPSAQPSAGASSEPTATPTPQPSGSASASAAATPSASPSSSPTPGATGSPSPNPSASASASASPTPGASGSPNPSASASADTRRGELEQRNDEANQDQGSAGVSNGKRW